MPAFWFYYGRRGWRRSKNERAARELRAHTPRKHHLADITVLRSLFTWLVGVPTYCCLRHRYTTTVPLQLRCAGVVSGYRHRAATRIR